MGRDIVDVSEEKKDGGGRRENYTIERMSGLYKEERVLANLIDSRNGHSAPT